MFCWELQIPHTAHYYLLEFVFVMRAPLAGLRATCRMVGAATVHGAAAHVLLIEAHLDLRLILSTFQRIFVTRPLLCSL